MISDPSRGGLREGKNKKDKRILPGVLHWSGYPWFCIIYHFLWGSWKKPTLEACLLTPVLSPSFGSTLASCGAFILPHLMETLSHPCWVRVTQVSLKVADFLVKGKIRLCLSLIRHFKFSSTGVLSFHFHNPKNFHFGLQLEKKNYLILLLIRSGKAVGSLALFKKKKKTSLIFYTSIFIPSSRTILENLVYKF